MGDGIVAGWFLRGWRAGVSVATMVVCYVMLWFWLSGGGREMGEWMGGWSRAGA